MNNLSNDKFNLEIKKYFNLPGINSKLTDFDETIHIKANCNGEKPFNISEEQYNDLLNKALIDEIYKNLSEIISKDSFKQYMSLFIYNVNDINDINKKIYEIRNKKWFLICNMLVGSILQYNLTDVYDNDKSFTNNKCGIYKIGTIYDNDIYIDPFLSYNYNKFSIVFNDFLNYNIEIKDNYEAMVKIKKIDSLSLVYKGNFMDMF